MARADNQTENPTQNRQKAKQSKTIKSNSNSPRGARMSKNWLSEAISSIEPAALAGDGHAAAILGLLRAQANGANEAVDDSAALERIRSIPDRADRRRAVARLAAEAWPDDAAKQFSMQRRLRRKLLKRI